jgi:Na+/melibiose symporter-like transporter
VINRQRITGWILIAVAGGYLVYFVKTRLLTAGLPVEKKEWLQFAGMVVCLVLGTINVRLAAMREQKRKLEQSNKKSA